ncbi:MAG: SEC-C metal-binding domain-containing protein [Pseudomonadota bacterium]|nr:SEC-C metal-binding domain-containing protein [Pseudomonadota bacterium]
MEAHNFDIRKHLLEYDDVANDQRKVVYQQRNELMESDDISDSITAIRNDVVNAVISQYVPPGSMEEQWNIQGLTEAIERDFGLLLPIQKWLDEDQSLHEENLRSRIQDNVAKAYEEKEKLIGDTIMRRFERDVMLQILDNHWKDHLAAMDYLRQGIGLRGYAQKDPKQEYKREAFEMFYQMLEQIKHDVVAFLAKVQVHSEQRVDEMEEHNRRAPTMHYEHADAGNALNPHANPESEQMSLLQEQKPVQQPYRRTGRKIGRNEPCWCGSGRKFKQCHGKLA